MFSKLEDAEDDDEDDYDWNTIVNTQKGHVGLALAPCRETTQRP